MRDEELIADEGQAWNASIVCLYIIIISDTARSRRDTDGASRREQRSPLSLVGSIDIHDD